MARIIVGVDESDNALRALRWAIEEARLRDAELELVHAYAPHARSYPLPDHLADPELGNLRSDEEVRRAHEMIIDEALAAVGDIEGVSIERSVRKGTPAAALCKAAEGADLLVVGARGLGGFRGLLLGSVTQQVTAHSPCPIVVVTPQQR
jgi:nucleotide-binding universal stress UspA family protein